MASPQIAASAITDMTSTIEPYTVSLPTGSGGLLIACISMDEADQVSVAAGSASWTELVQQSLGAEVTLAIYYRESTGSDTLLVETTGAQKGEAIVHRVSGAEAVATQAPEASTPSTGTDASVECNAVSPTGGSKDYLFIWHVAYDLGDRSITAIPQQYGNQLTGTSAGGGTASCDTANRAATTATEGPGVATLSATTDWICTVVAVHPGTGPVAAVGTRPGRLALMGYGA